MGAQNATQGHRQLGLDDNALSSSNAEPGQKSKDLVPVMFSWSHGAQNVSLVGTFNGWRQPLPMVRSGLEFHLVINLTREEHQYKFIVDDQWRYSQDFPLVHDERGNIHNVIDVSNYTPFHEQLSLPEEELSFQSEQLPDFSQYTTEPPTMPIVLAKSANVAVEPPMEKMPPNIPLRCISDHFYHDFGSTIRKRTRQKVPPEQNSMTRDGNVPGEDKVLLVAITQRFAERKFATSIVVTKGDRWPLHILNKQSFRYPSQNETVKACNPLQLACQKSAEVMGAAQNRSLGEHSNTFASTRGNFSQASVLRQLPKTDSGPSGSDMERSDLKFDPGSRV